MNPVDDFRLEDHATESDGPEPLEMVCVFSPPIVPGGYERGSDGQGA